MKSFLYLSTVAFENIRPSVTGWFSIFKSSYHHKVTAAILPKEAGLRMERQLSMPSNKTHFATLIISFLQKELEQSIFQNIIRKNWFDLWYELRHCLDKGRAIFVFGYTYVCFSSYYKCVCISRSEVMMYSNLFKTTHVCQKMLHETSMWQHEIIV